MAIFARPAVWSYDLPLFREAIADEEQLEALLAAIALKDEAVWVIESNEVPVAFAWGRREGQAVRLMRFYLSPHRASPQIAGALVARIQEQSKELLQLIAPEGSDRELAEPAFALAGFHRSGIVWTKSAAI